MHNQPQITLVASLALMMMAGCASSGPMAANDPADRMSRPAETPLQSIHWSSDRRLTWADFAGKPELSSGAAAVTTYVIWWQADCTRDGFSFQVISAFLPDQSWVKDSVLGRFEESQRALGHEQTHFDLSEVHARKMRQALGRLPRPCDMTEEQLLAVVQPIIQEDTDSQAAYDRQTSHGLDRLQQSEWDGAVARQLMSLSRYIGTAGTQAIPFAGGPGHRERRASLRGQAGGLSVAGDRAPRLRAAPGR